MFRAVTERSFRPAEAQLLHLEDLRAEAERPAVRKDQAEK